MSENDKAIALGVKALTFTKAFDELDKATQPLKAGRAEPRRDHRSLRPGA